MQHSDAAIAAKVAPAKANPVLAFMLVSLMKIGWHSARRPRWRHPSSMHPRLRSRVKNCFLGSLSRRRELLARREWPADTSGGIGAGAADAVRKP